MSSSGSKDFFGSFLEAADKSELPRSSGGGPPSDEAMLERALLGFLGERDSPVALRELFASISFPPSLVISALQKLADAKLVELRSVDSDETAELSDLGRKIRSMAA